MLLLVSIFAICKLRLSSIQLGAKRRCILTQPESGRWEFTTEVYATYRKGRQNSITGAMDPLVLCFAVRPASYKPTSIGDPPYARHIA